MKLPKLYRPIRIRFVSFRNGYSNHNGNICVHEDDVHVVRLCRRVLWSEGWRWQVVKENLGQSSWDDYFETDQEVLYNYGSSLEFETLWMGMFE